MRKVFVFVSISCFLLFLVTLGCNNVGLKGLVPVEGTVLYNGNPVEGANVRFAPETQGETARSAHATTDATGHFSLMTLEPGDGAFPGNYKISIQKYSEPPRPEMSEDMDHTERDKVSFENRHMKDEIQSLLPEKYGAAASSGLTANVPSEGVIDLKFELTD